MNADKKYKIKLENKAIVTVNLRKLFKGRWIEYFGGVDEVKKFIKNYI